MFLGPRKKKKKREKMFNPLVYHMEDQQSGVRFIFGIKLDMDDILAMPIMCRSPAATGFSRRTADLLLLPVYEKLGCIKPCCCLSLPTGIKRNGTKQCEAMPLLAGHKQFCIEI